MSDLGFLWPVDAPEAEARWVLRKIGFVEGVDFVHDGNTFRFATTEQAMQFNRSLADVPNTGRE